MITFPVFTFFFLAAPEHIEGVIFFFYFVAQKKPGAGASQDMRILTITANGAEMIFHGWGNLDDITLYRKSGSDSQSFSFVSANGDEGHYGGAWYITTADTKMDKSFSEAARYAVFSESYGYDNSGNYRRTEQVFNGQAVTSNEYMILMNTVMDGYIEIPYMPKGIIWDSGWTGDTYNITLLTETDIMSFLDAFEPENGYFDPAYVIQDFTSEDLVDYLLANVEKAYELVYNHGMATLVTGEFVDLNGFVCRMVYLGTSHDEHFVKEIHYAISPNGDIYEYDPVGDGWLLMYVPGAVG